MSRFLSSVVAAALVVASAPWLPEAVGRRQAATPISTVMTLTPDEAGLRANMAVMDGPI